MLGHDADADAVHNKDLTRSVWDESMDVLLRVKIGWKCRLKILVFCGMR